MAGSQVTLYGRPCAPRIRNNIWELVEIRCSAANFNKFLGH